MRTISDTIHILHVDDEPDIADMAATFLEREDERFALETVTSADEGLERLRDGEFDCLISDYDMPGMNGIEFLRTVREHHPDLPFILYTGKGSEEVAGDALSAGATDYLQKGSGTDQYELLANRIQNSVEQYHTKQRRATLERIRTIVNDINQALVRASSRQQLETEVCNSFTRADPYRFAVFAEVNPDTKQIEPSTWTGRGEAFLDDFAMSVADGAPGRQAPGGRAFHEREIAVAQDIQTDPSYGEWRDLALKYEFHALAVVPIEYESEFYGLLAVFSDRSHAFDDSEQELLEELGDDIAHAIHAQEVQNQLREERRFTEQALDTLDDIFYVIGTDGEIRRWNEPFSEITGYTDEELADMQAVDVFPEDEHERIRAALEETLETGRVTTEATLLTAEKDRIPYEFTGARLTDTENNLIGLVGIGRDITERKERQRELERFQEYTEHMRDAIDDLFYVLDTEGTLQRWNNAFTEVAGYSDEETASMKVIDFFPE
jgi:PAS domain S-box-containing protein